VLAKNSATNYDAGWADPSGAGGATLPPGTIMDYAGATAPSGYLLCDGAAVSRTTYAALFAAIGTAWGAGDGSTTFNVPDFKGRVAVGAGLGTGLTDRALAANGGEEDHQLIIAELAAHTHVQNAHGHTQTAHTHSDSGHTHEVFYSLVPYSSGGGSLRQVWSSGSQYASGSGSAALNSVAPAIANATASNQNTGGDGVHNNMQPFAVVNKIIKT
jgi:microcystin-dependent protein